MKLAAMFLIAAIILGAVGFGGLGSIAWSIGIVLGVIALILFVMSMIKGRTV